MARANRLRGKISQPRHPARVYPTAETFAPSKLNLTCASGDFFMQASSSIRSVKYAGALILAVTLAAGAASSAMAQPADPNYQSQAQDYQQKQEQYQAQQQEYNAKQQEYDAKQSAHADASAAYAEKRADYRAQRSDYAAQKRDYERARADYDARYGPGAFDTYTRTVTTRTYVPADGGPATTVRREVIEH
jgi:hypothetical protein